MKRAPGFILVLVTAPDLKTARRLARVVLKARIVACANLVPAIESHYWWRGKIERSRETLILFKTHHRRLPELERLVLQEHPYDTPEIVAMSLTRVTERYLRWLDQSISTDA